MRKTIKTHKNLHVNQQNEHTPADKMSNCLNMCKKVAVSFQNILIQMVGIANLQIYFLLKIQFIKTQEDKLLISLAEPLADPRGRQKRIPPRSNFFHFNAVFGKTAKQ